MAGPHVVIAGAGALGSLIGGLLAEGGLPVTLLARRADHVAAIRERGLRIVGQGGARGVTIGVATRVAEIAPADIVIVLCKAHATRELSEDLPPLLAPGAVVVSLQNGLGNEEIIAAAVGADMVLGGVTALGATLEAPGVVRDYARLPTLVGEMAGGVSTRARVLAEILSAHGAPTRASEDIVAEKWRKLMLNVAMSATSGLTGLSIGEIARARDLGAVARRAMDEAAAVARSCGVALDPASRDALFDSIVGSGAARNKTSMRRDIEAGRPSEVEAIYGAVIERGRARAIATPTLEALAALVRGLEAAGRAAGSAR